MPERQGHDIMSLDKIEAVILDWDGVCEFYKPFSQSLDHYDRAAVRAFNTVARVKGITCAVDFEDNVKLANQSFYNAGLSTKYFTDTYELSALDMHMEFHREIPREHTMSPVPGLREAILKLPHIKFVIVSQGSRSWVTTGVDQAGLSDIIGKDAILGFEDYGQEKKSLTDRGIRAGLDITGTCPTRTAMAEDMKKNLRIPASLGLRTAFIAQSGLEPQWIDLPKPEDDFVHHSFPTILPFLKSLERT